jgi:hypothetical protein
MAYSPWTSSGATAAPPSASTGMGSIGGGMRQPRRRPMFQQRMQASAPMQPQQPQQQFQPQQPSQTFSQMQQQGMARPAPQQMQQPYGAPYGAPQQPDITGQLSGAVSDALRNQSRYDLPQVQQVRSALMGQLGQEYGAQQQNLNEELARRGISGSSIAAGKFGDLAGQQGTAMANLNAQLIQNEASTAAADRAAALGAGQNLQSALAAQGLAGGQFGLEQQKFGESQRQFDVGQGLAEKQFGLSQTLGLGNLSIQQAAQKLDEQVQSGKLTLDQKDQALRELANQQQYGLSGRQQNLAELQNQQQYGIAGRQQSLAETLGLGNLSVSQAAQKLDEQVKTGQLTLEQKDQALRELQNQQQQGQFQQTFGEGQRQFNLSQDLEKTLGLGNLGVAQQQAATQQKAQEADQAYQSGQISLAQRDATLRELSNQQQYGLSQSAQDIQRQGLTQQGEIARQGDVTQNRQLDIQQLLGMLGLAGQYGLPAGYTPPPAAGNRYTGAPLTTGPGYNPVNMQAPYRDMSGFLPNIQPANYVNPNSPLAAFSGTQRFY